MIEDMCSLHQKEIDELKEKISVLGRIKAGKIADDIIMIKHELDLLKQVVNSFSDMVLGLIVTVDSIRKDNNLVFYKNNKNNKTEQGGDMNGKPNKD